MNVGYYLAFRTCNLGRYLKIALLAWLMLLGSTRTYAGTSTNTTIPLGTFVQSLALDLWKGLGVTYTTVGGSLFKAFSYADLNQDGYNDIAIPFINNTENASVLNKEDAILILTYDPVNQTYSTGSSNFEALKIGNGADAYFCQLVDMDGDGRPDLITAPKSTGNIPSIYLNKASNSNVSDCGLVCVQNFFRLVS